MTSPTTARWFRWSLAGIAVVGLSIRLLYIFGYRQDLHFGGDAFFYHAGANLLVDGHGFIWPFTPHTATPTAAHPPLYLLYLAIPSVFGWTSVLTHLLWSALLGVGTIVIVGLLGRDLGGPRLGLVAAALAATYPNLWVPDGSLMAETLAMFVTALALWLAYRYWRDPRWWRLALVGAAGGAAALSRSELVLMVPFLVLPLALLVPGITARQRWVGLGAGALVAVSLMSPWLVFNLTRFKQPELLSTQFGALLASTDCDLVWKSPTKSYYSVQCADNVRKRLIHGKLDESQADAVYRRAGIDYLKDHTALIPGVVAARLGAVVGVYRPETQINIDSAIEGREPRLARIGLYSFEGLALLSIAGAILLRRRRELPVFPLLVPPVVVLLTVAVGYASTRFRAPAEVTVCILAAVTIDAVIAWAHPDHKLPTNVDNEDGVT